MKIFIKILILLIPVSFYISCSKEADTISPSEQSTSYVDLSPGTKNLEVAAIYPSGVNVSRTADIVIVFSKPVDTATVDANVVFSGGALNAATFSGGDTIATLTPSVLPLANNTAYTVTVNTGVVAAAPDSSVMVTAGNGAFTTIDSLAETGNLVPKVLPATRYPSGLGILRNTGYVEVSFSESVDPLTVTNASFSIAPDIHTGNPYPVNANNKTFRLDLNPLLTAYSTLYTVTLTTAIRTTGLIPLDPSNLIWTFTTEATIVPGAVAIGSIWVTNVTDTGARINWSTNKAVTTSNVSYGLNSSFGSTSPNEAATTNTLHFIDLAGLTRATRYYFRANSDAVSSATGYFMTKGDGTTGYNVQLSTEAGNKSNLNAVRNTDAGSVYDGSSFVTWENGTIKAAYFDNDVTGTLQWGGINGTILDSNARTNSRTFIDYRGSLIVTMESGGNIYAKRVYDNGAGAMTFTGYDWGTSAVSTGSLVGSGTNPHLSIVWNNPTVVNADASTVSIRRALNTAVVPAAGNWFYDFNTDFNSNGTVVNDALLDRTGAPRGLSLVVNSGTTFRHAVDQSIANIVAGDTYIVGDGVTNFASFTATDHSMHLGTNYNNGTSFVYTPHGFTVPVWFGLNDIIFNGTNGAIISGAISPLIPTEIDTGTANANRLNHLIDGSTDFVAAAVFAGCYAMNTGDNNYSQISAVTTTDLTLSSDIFPNGNENYIVFSLGIELTYGSSSSTSAGQLVDSSNIFDTVPVGSYVLNTSNSKMAVVIAGSSGHNLNLSADIFTLGTENYEIWTGSQLTFGTANANRPGHLIDGTVPDFTLLAWDIAVRRHAVNTGNNTYTTVTGITTVDLALSADIFPGGTENYALYNLTVDTPIENGTAEAAPTPGKLVDYSAGINFYSAAAGDFAMNDDTKTLTTIATRDVNALVLNNDMFVSTNLYNIYTSSNNQSGINSSAIANEILCVPAAWVNTTDCYGINTTTVPNTISKINTVTAGVSVTLDDGIFSTGNSYTIVQFVSVGSGSAKQTITGELVDTANDFSAVSVGSYVVNTTANPDEVTTVSALSSHTINLDNDIFTTGSEVYYVVTDSGSIRTGNANADRANHLIDGSATFTSVASLSVGDYVKNTATNNYAVIQAGGITDTDLTLNADIFPGGNEGYQVIELTSMIGSSGTASSTAVNQLVDSDRWFSSISIPAPPSYIYVLNTSTNKATIVSSVVNSTTLALAQNIIVAGNNYQIWSGTQLASGGAKAVKSDHLIDGSALWTSAPVITLGDLVTNLGTGRYDSVIGTITDTDLTFGSDVFPVGNEGYRIYQDYCVTALHFGAGPAPYLGDAVNQFYRLQVDYSINTSAGDTVEFFNDKGITGTADALPVNPLLDNDIALDFTSGVTAVNDYVFNTTTGNIAQVNAVTYARGIGLTSNIFTVNGNGYTILRTTPYVVPGDVIDSENADSTVADQLHLTGANFTGIPVEKGDLVYNVTDNTYAAVIEVYADYLVINENIFAAGEGYIIFAANDRITETGINSTSGLTLTDVSANFLNPLNPVRVGDVVRNNNTGLQTTITAVAATTLTLQSALTFAAINQRYVILQPRAFVAYEKTTGPFTEIYGEYLRLHDGSNCGITVSIYTGSIAGYIQTAPDNSGNSFVFYEVGANIYAKRFNAIGTDLNGYLSTAPGFLIAAGSLIKVLPDGAGGVYILYENGGNVYLQRKTSAFANVWAPVTVAAGGVDSALALDSTSQPMVAYCVTASGFVRISKYLPATGAAIYSAQAVNILTIGTYGTYYQNTDVHKSNILIVSDNSTGAIVSWIDTRFMSETGFTIHALAVDGGGAPVPAWDANSGGAPADYNGVKIGIIKSDLASDISFKTINYDTVVPWSLRVIWQDYRAGISDIYYDNFSY